MKKKIKIFVIILLIIIAVFFIFKLLTNKNKDNQSKINKIYDSLNSKQEFILEMEKDENNKLIMAKKDDKCVIDSYTDKSRDTTIIKDNNTYLILHDRQEYFVYENNNIDQSILTDEFKELLDKNYIVGKEKVQGKKYNYEEYEGSTLFAMSNSSQLEENNVKTRFYFNKKTNLAYIKTIYEGNGEELLKVNLSYKVDDSIFEIPKDYAENY